MALDSEQYQKARGASIHLRVPPFWDSFRCTDFTKLGNHDAVVHIFGSFTPILLHDGPLSLLSLKIILLSVSPSPS